jgi:hypothetical protein
MVVDDVPAESRSWRCSSLVGVEAEELGTVEVGGASTPLLENRRERQTREQN